MQSARPNTAGAYQYRYFGGFRLLLAALVMLQHFSADMAPVALGKVMVPYTVGNIAVLVFFALSGFVITEAVDCVYSKRPGAFLTNRLLRIGPHFVLAVALSMLAHEFFRITGGQHLWRLQPTFPVDAFDIQNVLLNFVSIIPGANHGMSYDFLDISWAVRVEMLFYLAMFGCIVIGRWLPGEHGFVGIACALTILLAPAFWSGTHEHGSQQLTFLPYFVFGGGLYFASLGSRTGWLTLGLSIPFMFVQYWSFDAQVAPWEGIPHSPFGALVILIMLLGALTILAFAQFGKHRRADQMAGDLTYPLYLYHEVVLIVLLTLFPTYSYGVFAAGIVLSLAVSAILMALLDPVVTHYRDLIRGRRLPRGGNRLAVAPVAR